MNTTIRDLRADLGLSQDEMAAEIGTTRGTVLLLENGHRYPSPRMLRSYAAFLGVPRSEIVNAARATKAEQSKPFCSTTTAADKEDSQRVEQGVSIEGGDE